jgi:hypothetical protein
MRTKKLDVVEAAELREYNSEWEAIETLNPDSEWSAFAPTFRGLPPDLRIYNV